MLVRVALVIEKYPLPVMGFRSDNSFKIILVIILSGSSVKSFSCSGVIRPLTLLCPVSSTKVKAAMFSIKPEHTMRFPTEQIAFINKASLDPRGFDIDINNENMSNSWVTPKIKQKNDPNPDSMPL